MEMKIVMMKMIATMMHVQTRVKMPHVEMGLCSEVNNVTEAMILVPMEMFVTIVVSVLHDQSLEHVELVMARVSMEIQMF